MPALVTVIAVLAITAAALTATAHGASARKPNPAVEIGAAKIPKLGTVLVNGAGHVLYMFEPDDHAKVVCSATCQKIWPPVVAPRRGVARARYGARQSLIGSDRNPADGRRIVTYDGWPLYTYVLDKRRHQDNGQNIALNGGYWWALSPAGKIIRTPISHGGGYVGS
jgi:predicted lipoprotein with Yx(FWY)xxD motif